MTRSCGATGVEDGCTTTAGIETCICSGDLCNSAGAATNAAEGSTNAAEGGNNAAGGIAASTSFMLMALILTKFFFK